MELRKPIGKGNKMCIVLYGQLGEQGSFLLEQVGKAVRGHCMQLASIRAGISLTSSCSLCSFHSSSPARAWGRRGIRESNFILGGCKQYFQSSFTHTVNQ